MPTPLHNYLDEIPSEQPPEFGPTLTVQETIVLDCSPAVVYQSLKKLRTIVQALPELRVLRVVDGDTFFWKIEYGNDFALEGEIHFTQRAETDIVLWQSTDRAPTQVSGSIRFHAVDEPVDFNDDEAPNTHLTLTMHWLVLKETLDRIGPSEVERRIGNSFREGLGRIKQRLEESVEPPIGLRKENIANHHAAAMPKKR
jgi:uncharacterized membrane protein